MRISADTIDPDFDIRAVFAKVSIDGVELKRCITADEEAGECLCYRIDQNGRLCVDAGEIATETIRGKVSITFPERF